MTKIPPFQGKETKLFYETPIENALERCLNEGYRPLFMPELIQARIDNFDAMKYGFTAQSITATGRTKQGTYVVVYAHIPTFLSNPANIREARNSRDGNVRMSCFSSDIKKILARGRMPTAGEMLVASSPFMPIPQTEFQRIVDLEDKKNVWVVDWNIMCKAPFSEGFDVRRALEHPQTIPFIGSEGLAQSYLQAHRKYYGHNKIGIYRNNDLLDDEDFPTARLLFLGYDDCTLDSVGGLGYIGSLVGVKEKNS